MENATIKSGEFIEKLVSRSSSQPGCYFRLGAKRMLTMNVPQSAKPRLIEGLKDTDETIAQEILALLKLSRKPLALKDIGEAVDVSPSKVRRIVTALKESRDVTFKASNDGYLVSLA